LNENISLIFYDNNYNNVLEKFELESTQEQFTAYPQEIFKTLVDSERHYILIIQGQRVVGYFVLHENNGPLEIGSHNKALLIRALAISKNEQGKGYALSAMKMLPDFTKKHFKNIEELVLIVNHANIPAQNLYSKSGFSDTGMRRNGKHGLQFIYQEFLR
jgi:RimJ/RimL family protein N-acetyltransferase